MKTLIFSSCFILYRICIESTTKHSRYAPRDDTDADIG